MVGDAGEIGHINPDSGHGAWPEGLLSLGKFLGKLNPRLFSFKGLSNMRLSTQETMTPVSGSADWKASASLRDAPTNTIAPMMMVGSTRPPSHARSNSRESR